MNHIKRAHLLWQETLQKGMHVIDATAGNGHDTLALAKFVLTPTTGFVWALDIQETALQKTALLLQNNLPKEIYERVRLLEQSHETFPQDLPPIDLIVYNLGYLPGGDHEITTKASSTVESLKNALHLLSPKGQISLTMYPGHPEGLIEKNVLTNFLSEISLKYKIDTHISYNSPRSPIFVSIAQPSV